ncbi:unnamed protein product [Closterium sp. NIES-54]
MRLAITCYCAAALGATESSNLPSTAPAEALHTFTLDSGALRCFFCDSTTLTPLPAPVPVRLADPSGGPVMASSSTILPCPAVPFGSLSGLHLPSFSTNLVSTAALQDAMVTTTNPGGQHVSICTCTRTGRHLAVFTRRPGSSLYTPATEPSQVAVSAQVSAFGQVAASCSCGLLSHKTLLWHHRLGHPSLPRRRGMRSCLLRAAPHSSFPATTAPLQTIHMDVWSLARVSGQSCERYFLLSVSSSANVSAMTFLSCVCTLIEVKNGIAELRIGLVMEVARTSMIHAAAPHFLWQFPVRYAAHQLNLSPRFSLPETSPTLRWTGEVGDASVFWVWGSRAFVHDTSADKLSPYAIPYDVTFDESVPFYRLFPYRSAPPPPPPLFLAPCPTLVDPLPPQGPAPSGVSQVDPLPGLTPTKGAEPRGAKTWGAEPRGVAIGSGEPGGAEPQGVEPGGAASEGAESGVAEP